MFRPQITLKSGDLFQSGAMALVNPVNCVGVMGKGLALEFKKRFPEAFLAYKNACAQKTVRIGKVFTWVERETLLIHFPTKNHWKDPSKIEYIQSGLPLLEFAIEWNSVRSIAIPGLGCGLGGLPWGDVKEIIISHFKKTTFSVPVEIFLYAPPWEENK